MLEKINARDFIHDAKLLLKVDTDEAFANAIGEKKATVDKWIQRKKIPLAKKIYIESLIDDMPMDEDMVEFYKNTTTRPIEDLITDLKNQIKDIETCKAPDMIEIKYHADIHTAAGYGALNGDSTPETMYFPSVMLRQMFGINDFKDLEIINVIGDSMEPIVSNGETILIKRADTAKNNQTVIVRVGEHLLLKKFQIDPLGRWIRLTSENELYKAMDFNDKEIEEVRVVGILIGKFKPY